VVSILYVSARSDDYNVVAIGEMIAGWMPRAWRLSSLASGAAAWLAPTRCDALTGSSRLLLVAQDSTPGGMAELADRSLWEKY